MRDRILEVAQALVQSIGANAMSYQHISERVGIRKASIHHHFATKEKLIEALIERYSEYFFGVVDEIIASRKSGMGKLKDYMMIFEATLREGALDKACPMGMLGAEVRSLGEDAADKVKRFYGENERRLVEILEEGRRDGSLKYEGSSAAMAGVVFTMLEGAMLVARGRGSSEYFRSVSDQLVRMLKG